MKIKPSSIRDPQLTAIGKPYDEGYGETVDPKTGNNYGDVLPGSIEMFPIDVPDRDQGTSHEGDMGRLGKSE